MTETNDEIIIGQIKQWADAKKYFGLFDKYLPRYENDGKNRNILIVGISNEDVILKICELNKEANFYIADKDILRQTLPILNDEYNFKFSYLVGDSLYNMIKNTNMKFDCIIMNPPYERNLHLKILAEAIKHLNNENSVCVNLSPIRWLQDPLAKYKKNSDYRKFEQSISKHIEDMLIIEAVNVQSIFMNANIGARLGVYKLRKQTTTFDYEKLSHNAIVSKSIEYIITNNPNLEMNKQYGWRVRMPLILSGKANGSGVRKPTLSSFGALKYFNDGKYSDGRWWHECYQKNQHSKSTPYITLSIEFENENKCKNFIFQFNSSFARYITDLLLGDVHISPEKVLWMENAINPRTGLKGYDSEWIDEDFCKFFNINGFISDTEAEPNSEWETILKTIEKYK